MGVWSETHEEIVTGNKEEIRRLENKIRILQSQYHDYKATCTKIIEDQRLENLKLQEKIDTLKQIVEIDGDSLRELCDRLKVKNDKIEELSTKLAEVVMGRDAFKTAHLIKCSEVESLEEKVEDLESTIEGQKEQISDLENEISDLKMENSEYRVANDNLLKEVAVLRDRLGSTPDNKDVTKGPDKIPDTHQMPDYEGLRKVVEEHLKNMPLGDMRKKYGGWTKAVEEAQRKMMEERNNRPIFGYFDNGIWETFFNE